MVPAIKVKAEEYEERSAAYDEEEISKLVDEELNISKKKHNKRRKKKQNQDLNKWYVDTLERSKFLIEGIPEAKLHEIPEVFNGYSFTGTLRPHLVTPQRVIDAELNIYRPDYHLTGVPQQERDEYAFGKRNIHIYSPAEIEKVREVSRLGREVLDIAGKYLKVGVTGDEIDRIVHQAILDRSAYPSTLNYRKFPKSLCISVNEVICHGIPDCRPFEDGDIVNLDVCLCKDGFHTDLNETYLVGKCDEESINLVKTAYECLQKACEVIKPGMMYRDVGQYITKHASQNHMPLSVVRDFCGHGTGRLLHTAPDVPHYARNKAIGIMRPGHIFTIEPMINVGNNWGGETWPDEWTVVTLNGKRSAQFEHTFLVTEIGVEILTARLHTPIDKMVWDLSAVQR